MAEIHIVFDGPPGPEGGRFVEVETPDSRSVRVGRWVKHSGASDWHSLVLHVIDEVTGSATEAPVGWRPPYKPMPPAGCPEDRADRGRTRENVAEPDGGHNHMELTIPLPGGKTVEVIFDEPLTSDQFDNLTNVLYAMKPGIVLDEPTAEPADPGGGFAEIDLAVQG